jgi:hypothetical protein
MLSWRVSGKRGTRIVYNGGLIARKQLGSWRPLSRAIAAVAILSDDATRFDDDTTWVEN